MTRDGRGDWRENIPWTAVLRQIHFHASASCLDRFNEDEFVLVRNDHAIYGMVLSMSLIFSRVMAESQET